VVCDVKEREYPDCDDRTQNEESKGPYPGDAGGQRATNPTCILDTREEKVAQSPGGLRFRVVKAWVRFRRKLPVRFLPARRGENLGL